VTTDQDWKQKYYDSLQNLDDHQAQWNELEDLLRKAATRLAITAKGIDKRLDKVLADIQKYIRNKNDIALTEALDKLSNVLAQIDDEPAASVSAGTDNDRSDVDFREPLHRLVQRLVLAEADQQRFDRYLDELTELDSDQCITRLADLINAGISNPDGQATGAKLQSDPVGSVDIQHDSDSVREVLITLVEKIAFTHGESQQLNAIKKMLDDGFDEQNWHAYLDEIITELRAIIDGVNDEKGELESLIVDVTRQLTEISSVLNEEREAHLQGHEQARQLQSLMDHSVKQISISVDSVADVHQLKAAIHENLGAIKTGIQDFVHHDAERFKQSEARNGRLLEQIGALEKESEQLKLKLSEDRRKLMFDALTGARSRLSYEELLEQEMYRWRRYKEVFSFAILDIDHFKQINDNFGHNAGDKALKVVAQMMGRNIRKTDFLFRIGGEEFVLLLPKTNLPGSQPLVEKLRQSIGRMDFHFKQQKVEITLSAGLTTVAEGDTAESIYERADKALYQAKHGGRNQLVTT